MSNASNETNDRPQVILLNGASSVGKTSIAKAIQDLARRPFLHVQLDAFLGMLPSRALDDPSGLMFDRVDGQTIDVKLGHIVQLALIGMRNAVASMAECGNNLIVDDVFFGDEDAEYRRLLQPYDLRLVGLFAPLAVLQDRERARGDRDIGLAKGQIERVHNGRSYDLELDTAHASPSELAKQICDAFDL